jgi:hypothetical protein
VTVDSIPPVGPHGGSRGSRDEMSRLDRVPTRTPALLRTYRHIGPHVDPHILDGKPLTTLRAIPGHENLIELGQRMGVAPPGFSGECRLVVALTVAIARVHCYRPARSGRDCRFVRAPIEVMCPDLGRRKHSSRAVDSCAKGMSMASWLGRRGSPPHFPRRGDLPPIRSRRFDRCGAYGAYP